MARQGQLFATSVPSWLIAGLVLALLVLAATVPIGFKDTPENDGWTVRNRLDQGGSIQQDAADSSRAFYFWIWPIAGWLTPETFVGHQVVLAILHWLRGLLAFLLMVALRPGHRRWALAVACVTLFHPADTGYFWLGSLNTNAQNVTYLLAALTLVVAIQRQRPWVAALSLVLLALALWSYEAYFLVLVILPVFIVRSRLNSRLTTSVLIAWYALLTALALHKLVILANELGRSARVVDASVLAALASLALSQARLALLGFLEAFSTLPTATTSQWVAVAGTFLLMAGAGRWLGDSATAPSATPSALTWRQLLLLGVLVSILGFVPYAVSDLRWIQLRTSLVSAIGAAIVLITLPERLPTSSARTAVIQWALAAALTSLSLGGAVRLHQTAHFRVLDEQRILANISARAPRFAPGTGIVLLFEDSTAELRARGLARRHAILTSALQFLYDDASLVAFSLGEIDHPAFPFQVGPTGVSGVTTGGRTMVPYDQLVVFSAAASGSVEIVERLPWPAAGAAAYRPLDRILSGSAMPERICLNLSPAVRPTACN
jgi:hypothetical protein